jgi:hypothetical protein
MMGKIAVHSVMISAEKTLDVTMVPTALASRAQQP